LTEFSFWGIPLSAYEYIWNRAILSALLYLPVLIISVFSRLDKHMQHLPAPIAQSNISTEKKGFK